MSLTTRSVLFVAIFAFAATASAQTWQPGPSVPTPGGVPRTHGAAVIQGGTLFLLGGTPFDAGGDGAAHSFSGSAWTTTTATEGMFLDNGAAIDNLGRIIVFGGVDPGGDVGEPYEWTVADGDAGGVEGPSSSLAGRNFAWARDDSGLIYVLGGGAGAFPTTGDPNVARVERFDGAADAWSVLAPLPFAAADAAACNDGQGRILVFGGFDAAGVPMTEVLAYDVATGTWSSTLVPDMPSPRAGHAAVRGSDGLIYVIGGSNGVVLATTDVLDPVTLTWSVGPSLTTARQHFGCALLPSGDIHVIGGETAAGGTNTTELLFTPTCPIVTTLPASREAYLGGAFGLRVEVDGTAPFTYLWRKDGVPLVDGMQGTGSTVVGSTAAELAVHGADIGDAGAYDCVISNACGSTISAGATVTMIPTAKVPVHFAVSELHPAGATSSVASGADDGEIVGSAKYPHPMYNSLDHPIYWASHDTAGIDITPAGSVGGVANEIENGTIVGWWWWPYTTSQGTGYNQHASVWTNSGATHFDVQSGGWEFGSLSDTDGTHHIGTQRYDESSTNSDAFYWPQNNGSAARLTPPTAWGSSASAIDGVHQFGSVHWGFGVVRATGWSASSGSWFNMSPAASGFSYIVGAGDGQQVGRITLGGNQQPAVWSGTAESAVSLGSGYVHDCEGGLQVGSSTIGGTSSAVIWRGSASSPIDLHAYLPPRFTYSTAHGIDIESDGTITVVGSGFDSVDNRTEALAWRGKVPTLTQDVTTISAAAGGTVTFTVDGGPGLAGHVWLLLGSVTGTSPGLPLGGGLELPLVVDVYTSILLADTNPWIAPLAGFFPPSGVSTALGTFPAGLVTVPAAFDVYHAFVVLTADFSAIGAVSNPATLTIVP